MKKPQYIVVRKFIGGILDGITHTEITTVKFSEGWICQRPIGGSPYKIVSCEPVSEFLESARAVSDRMSAR